MTWFEPRGTIRMFGWARKPLAGPDGRFFLTTLETFSISKSGAGRPVFFWCGLEKYFTSLMACIRVSAVRSGHKAGFVFGLRR